MIRYEIKKIFSKSLSKVSLVVLLFSLLISCYFAITNVSFLDEQGKSHTGIAAAKSLREEKQKWKGVLDEAALQAVLDEYKKISEEYPIRPGDDSANLLHDSKVQGFSEIKDMINMGFCEFRDFNYYRIDSLSKEEVGQIYENRGKSLEKWLNSEDADGLFDENEKAFLIEQYREMKAPLYYEDYDGWKSALSYAQTIIMLIMLVSAFLVSGIFSNEFSWKSDSIFFSTKYGRDRGTRAKIMAGFIVVSVIYFIVISLYSLAVDINADTSKCSRDDVYNWLLENSYKYGFIQRYPSGKTSITGVANEPWHYRYVGKKAAEEIHQSGMCLEEYVENLK